MAEFIDAKGRVWDVKLTLGAAKRVMDTVGVNLLNPAKIVMTDKDGAVSEDSVIARLANDDLFLGEIVAAIVAPMRQTRNVSADDFLESIDGATSKKIQGIFLDEYQNFFTARGATLAVNLVKALTETIATQNNPENVQSL